MDIEEFSTLSLLQQYEATDDSDRPEISTELWNRAIDQSSFGTDSALIVRYFALRLGKATTMSEKVDILFSLDACLNSAISGSDDQSRAILEVIGASQDIYERLLNEDCDAEVLSEDCCDVHELTINLMMRFNPVMAKEATIRWLSDDRIKHRSLWPTVAKHKLWDQFDDLQLIDCANTSRRSIASLAVCVLLSRGSSVGRQMMKDLLQSSDPFYSPSQEEVDYVCIDPINVGLPVLLEFFRRVSDPSTAEHVACAILRNLWNDRRSGWENRRIETVDQKIYIRYPDVSGEVPLPPSNEFFQSIDIIANKSLLRNVQTDLWALFNLNGLPNTKGK